MSSPEKLTEALRRVRERSPRIHCLTNPVTMQDVANLLLAAGGSTIMAQDVREVQEIVSQCQGLLLNTGVPDEEKLKAWILAGQRANQLGLPVVLDPVGAGASRFRREALRSLLSRVRVSVIRCNQGEAAALLEEPPQAGEEKFPQGVEEAPQAGEEEAWQPHSEKRGLKPSGVESGLRLAGDGQRRLAEALARRYGCTALVSGETDLVSDGKQWARLQGGDGRTAKITGSGCMLSALCALLCGAGLAPYEAACGAGRLWKESARLAGLWAGENTMKLGAFHAGLFDAVGQLCWEKITEEVQE